MPRVKNKEEQQKFIKGATARRKQQQSHTPRKEDVSSSKEPSSKDDSLEFEDDDGVDSEQIATPYATKGKGRQRPPYGIHHHPSSNDNTPANHSNKSKQYGNKSDTSNKTSSKSKYTTPKHKTNTPYKNSKRQYKLLVSNNDNDLSSNSSTPLDDGIIAKRSQQDIVAFKEVTGCTNEEAEFYIKSSTDIHNAFALYYSRNESNNNTSNQSTTTPANEKGIPIPSTRAKKSTIPEDDYSKQYLNNSSTKKRRVSLAIASGESLHPDEINDINEAILNSTKSLQSRDLDPTHVYLSATANTAIQVSISSDGKVKVIGLDNDSAGIIHNGDIITKINNKLLPAYDGNDLSKYSNSIHRLLNNTPLELELARSFSTTPGIINLGNTCYMSAALQVLFHHCQKFLIDLKNFIETKNIRQIQGAHRRKNMMPLSQAVLEVARRAGVPFSNEEAPAVDESVVDPAAFKKNIVDVILTDFNEIMQVHDAQEFLNQLINEIDEEMKAVIAI